MRESVYGEVVRNIYKLKNENVLPWESRTFTHIILQIEERGFYMGTLI